MIRTHEAGALRAGHVGETVTLAGWVARRRDHGGVIFIDLRDRSGSVQVVFREGAMALEDLEQRAHRLRAEFCVQVVGEVVARPAGNENPELPTGDIEVVASTLQVLSSSAPLPFPIETAQPAGDAVPTAAFALRWVIDQPGVTTVIPGARNVTQVRGNVAAATMAPLSDSQLSDLERVYDERIRAHVHDRW